MLVGAIYKRPDLLVDYGQYIKSKYDFADEAGKFFYDCAETIYQTRSQELSKNTVNAFMTENAERLQKYKLYKGYKFIEGWMRVSKDEDIDNYFKVVKKYSLIREYQRNGFNVDVIMSLKNFEKLSAEDVYRIIRGQADRINTVILTNTESEILNSKLCDTINQCMKAPDMGAAIPYPIMSDLFRGVKLKSMMAVGMLSNAGKSRYMFKLIAYLSLVLKHKCLVLLNEMTLEDMRLCLLTTVVNNPEFQQLHGIHITKKEREIALGMYRDARGEIIYREKDEWGDFTESVTDYIQRVSANSAEYRNLIAISQWIEDNTQGIIFAKDICNAYDDKTLEFEIRKAVLTNGVQYCFYDTLKSDIADTGDWAAFKATSTKLSELAKQLNIFVYGSIQLTDEVNYIKPDELTSSHISSCKSIKHILHTLVLFKEVPKEMYFKYGYYSDNPDWGDGTVHDLDEKKRYYVGNVDKNRFGSKKHLLFEVNLDTNVWTEVGELVKK